MYMHIIVISIKVTFSPDSRKQCSACACGGCSGITISRSFKG